MNYDEQVAHYAAVKTRLYGHQRPVVHMERFGHEILTLVDLARKLSVETGTTVAEIRSGKRSERMSRIRAEFTRQAVFEHHKSCAEVARFLGRRDSTIRKNVSRMKG